MASGRILIVEDDAAIRRGLVDAVRASGFTTYEAADGRDGAEMALAYDYDLLLLDLVLPGRDGLAILRELRATRPRIPVIILTARGAEAERVEGLRLGADDYVVKPFGVFELLARIEAVLRRSPDRPTSPREAAFAGGDIDFERREVRFADGAREILSEREAELLRYLAHNSRRAVSREEAMERVWRAARPERDTRTVDMAVTRLRVKLRDDPKSPRILLTLRGKGYMLALKEPVR